MRYITNSALKVALGLTFVFGTANLAHAQAKIGWKGSTYIKDTEQGYSVKFGGRIMNDWVFNFADSGLDTVATTVDGTKFRRVRLFSSGTIYGTTEYKVQFDFGGGDADFKDVWIGVNKVPVLGSVRVGHQYEPAGLEALTSSKVITFIERANVTSLMPERKTGVKFIRKIKQNDMTVSGGVFVPSDSYGDASGNDYAYTGRVTALPWSTDEGAKFVHVGVSGSYRDGKHGEYQEKIKPENPISPTLLDTGHLDVDNVALFGGEGAAVIGPCSVQGEYALASITGNPDSLTEDSSISSYYVQVAYTLTGERRGYKGGQMGGIKPKANFDGEGGVGAWELAARFSATDMDDDALMLGKLSVITVGLNWYLNPYTRVMMNYARTDLDEVGTMDSFMTRFQISF